MTPYYSDASVSLFLGDCRDLLPEVGRGLSVVVTDPPYGDGSTRLAWDMWPTGWVDSLAQSLTQPATVWCFGSLRMFLDRRDEFTGAGWKLAQDIVWAKHNGTGFRRDRFRRTHEYAVQWYLGSWDDLYHEQPTEPTGTKRAVRRQAMPAQWKSDLGPSTYQSESGGDVLINSVFRVRSMHGNADHPTQKPTGILEPLIRYSCPPGAAVLDPFAGSGSTLVAAKALGRSAVGIEADERYCEVAARRLAQGALPFGEASA